MGFGHILSPQMDFLDPPLQSINCITLEMNTAYFVNVYVNIKYPAPD